MNLKSLQSQITAEGGITTRNRVLFSSIDSTNAVGRRIASFYHRNGHDLAPTVLLALEQTSGRGRLGNRWLSPTGGIYVSIVLPVQDASALSMLPMRVATALCRELDAMLPVPCRVKWPNDLIVNGRKVGGILIEAVGSSEPFTAIVGFGINYSTDLPELADKATSLAKEAQGSQSLTNVAGRLIRALEADLQRRDDLPQVAEAYSRMTLHDVGEEISCRTTTEVHRGRFLGFDERGFLRIRTEAGDRLIPAGEIVEKVGIENHES